MRKEIYFICALIFFCFCIRSGRAFCQEANNCDKCHQKEQAAELDRIHFQEGVSCIDCHGGNPKGGIKSTAHDEGFTGKINRQDIPKLCAKCHSDVRKMNPYGLPTDQYAQYLTSKHGEALSAGKTDIATCIDCHNSHGIRRVRDPESPVYPKNVPSTCGKCHSNKELMDKYELPSTAEALYRQSIHAEMLLKKDDLSAPTCVTCHGNHGAVPPGLHDISNVCGKCHIKQQEFFSQSPHAPLSKEGNFKSCITCHSNHKINRTPNEIFKRCSTCHDEGDKAMTKRDSIFALIDSTEHDFKASRERLTQMTRACFHTEDEEVMLADAKTAMLQLQPIQHTLDVGNVKKISVSTTDVLREIKKRLDSKENMERIKKLSLIPIWLFLIVLAIAFYLKRKQIEKARNNGKHFSDSR